MAAIPYHAPALGGLFLGELFSGRTINQRDINIQHGPMPYNQSSNWNFRPGSYTPKQFVGEVALLLESVIVQLGPDSAGDVSTRSILMDGLRSSLSHEGRETTLPLSDWKSPKPSEITQQALRVGKKLFEYAQELHGDPKISGDPNLTVYSPCEGHKWVPPAGRLLRSHRSSPILMMLYNEWIHQFTCLRDGLLPFENFEDVQFNLLDTSARGTRPLEEIRKDFVWRITTGKEFQPSMIEIAKTFTAPNLAPGGYGFQYDRGTVLPSSIFTGKPSIFLRYIPATLIESIDGPVLFEFETRDQASADESNDELVSLLTSKPQALSNLALQPELLNLGKAGSKCQLRLTGTNETDKTFSVDVGRIVLAHTPTEEGN